MESVAVVIPALNEGVNLPHVLGALPKHVRAVVVDNGSTDDTAAVARACGAEVVLAPQRGYGSAVLAGFAHLAANPPDIVCVLDGDFADDPSRIGVLTGPIARDEADFVLADRTWTATPGALEPAQVAGNWLATNLMAMVTGRKYRDMGPFRAIRWTSLATLHMEDPTWGWNVEMQMKAVQNGLRILEIPMPYRKRRAGRSKISGSIRGTARAGARILWAVHRYR